MKLSIPEPKIELYKDGIFKPDTLNRKPMATKLSNLVESIDDPLVIALDGGWGSGKSVFLKCWVGEHLKTHPDQATTLYFDAYEHDYLDGPLIALTGALADRLDEEETSPALLAGLRKAAYKLLPMMARAGLAVVTAGSTKIADELTAALINQSSENVEKAAEAYWKQEDGRRAAMEEFRVALTALTKPNEKDEPQQKLVIVIDELDRCRPDYALQMLEVIKHFFATPGVHFVLGTNMQELANSVRATYGAGIDADRYLHKFVRVRMPMPAGSDRRPSHGYAVEHFGTIAEKLAIPQDAWRVFNSYLCALNQAIPLTLRDVEQLTTLIAVTPCQHFEDSPEYQIFAGLLIIKVLKPAWIGLARTNQLEYDNLDSMFRMQELHGGNTLVPDPQMCWQACLNHLAIAGNQEVKTSLGDHFMNRTRKTIIPDLSTQSLDAFELPSD
ncbi:P-loop NTPase fold protein [Yoonia sp. I 8.24]|uniref:KAP family P-loop NTPase fold protein n=1 Tax=Yoonia sp. I 8.24 TaxID=1537229 RepID=UPI001EDF6BD2|nr:P-loop NTPase fold protein [Yoonia sp. I 8.24]MCG3268783.1 hypothetical protein [Yoonia sp. I 8.24]